MRRCGWSLDFVGAARYPFNVECGGRLTAGRALPKRLGYTTRKRVRLPSAADARCSSAFTWRASFILRDGRTLKMRQWNNGWFTWLPIRREESLMRVRFSSAAPKPQVRGHISSDLFILLWELFLLSNLRISNAGAFFDDLYILPWSVFSQLQLLLMLHRSYQRW